MEPRCPQPIRRDGTGKVADLSLAQLKALRLRQDEGGPDAAITDQSIPTLNELLALAKDRIVLNLDVKDAIYGEVVDAVHRVGARDRGSSSPLPGLHPCHWPRSHPIATCPSS
ncbi:hypothetical protein [Sphingomonas sp.]|uniref:hypothetical protein n=1 Tax=Sphingomonas sp. TaxID=28214 RepID=UPI0031D9C7C1